ncbi:medium-chain fatty-acid--CoA ligase [Sporichthya brevicatena]|uniref:Medium-chain fatty-acid--CoA ligase n=1 Tax=Sporichthya brevicatena TaxID=171442 RepID=A0ABP3RS89_9ACTN
MERIGDLLTTAAQARPDAELFSFGDVRVTYAEFDEWVTAVASDLVCRGVQRGDRVLVQLPNCLEALVLQVAAFRIGAVNTPVIPIYREHEMRQILGDARPAVVAAAAALGPRRPTEELDGILAELDLTPAVRYVVGGVVEGWSAVPTRGSAVEAVPLPEPQDAEDTTLLLYTSGTTSAPKGVRLSSRALLAHLENFKVALSADENTVIVCGTPLSHLGGFVAGVVFPAYLGARSVILDAWRPDEAAQIIERERGTLMMGATVFLSDLVQRYEAGAGAEHRLSVYACAGATIPPAVIVRAESVGIQAMRAYGMTETAGVCAIAGPEHDVERRSEWDGRIVPGMAIQAVDEAREPLPPGEVGEFRIRGPQLLSGYTDPELTRSQIDDEGWFYPGDVGIVDQHGWVRVTGRTKDIINRGGEKLSALDIEAAVAGHPDVAAVAVTAVPDDRLGEAVGAWVVLREGATWSGPEPILAHLETTRLAKQKFPTEWHVVPALPLTATGKVRKQELQRT